MGKYRITGKLLGFILGLALTGNFVGALLQALFGHFLFDYKESPNSSSNDSDIIDDQATSLKANILRSLLTVCVYFLSKTKNKITANDINSIKEFFLEKFRFDLNDIVLIEKNIVHIINNPEKIDIRTIAVVINHNCKYEEKLNLIELLFTLSRQENVCYDRSYMTTIAELLNIKKLDYKFMKTQYADKIEYFEILGLSPDAEINDIKKAYRKLAVIHHPDKAKDNYDKEKFQKIVEAYNCLTKTASTGS